jgi:hypothetical protein
MSFPRHKINVPKNVPATGVYTMQFLMKSKEKITYPYNFQLKSSAKNILVCSSTLQILSAHICQISLKTKDVRAIN